MGDKKTSIGATITMTYMGRRINGKKLGYYYLASDTGEYEIYSRKLTGTLNVGCVLECTRTEDGVRGKYILRGQHKDKTEVDKWCVADDMVYRETALIREAKKKRPTGYDQCVKELREMRSKLSPAQRQIFMYKLMDDIIKTYYN